MTTEHPDTDTLADFAEELLAPQDSAELKAHIASCADCSATLTALAELSNLLGDEPAPPLPEDVAAQIDQALAEESARAHTEARRLRRRRARRVVSRAVLGLAATVVIGLAGLAVVKSGQESANSNAASSANRGAADSVRVFTRSGLAAQIDAMLAEYSSMTSSGTATGPATAAASGTTSTHPQAMTGNPQDSGPVSVPACALTAAGHSGAAPLASGAGFFEGHRVFALVYPATTGTVDVVLVRADCEGSSPGKTAAKPTGSGVLLEETVPRH